MGLKNNYYIGIEKPKVEAWRPEQPLNKSMQSNFCYAQKRGRYKHIYIYKKATTYFICSEDLWTHCKLKENLSKG